MILPQSAGFRDGPQEPPGVPSTPLSRRQMMRDTWQSSFFSLQKIFFADFWPDPPYYG